MNLAGYRCPTEHCAGVVTTSGGVRALDCEIVTSESGRVSGTKKATRWEGGLELSRLLPKHSLTYMVVIHDATSNTRASHGMLSLVHDALQWMHSAVHWPGGSMASSVP